MRLLKSSGRYVQSTVGATANGCHPVDGPGMADWRHSRRLEPDVLRIVLCTVLLPQAMRCTTTTFATPTARARSTCPAGCIDSVRGS